MVAYYYNYIPENPNPNPNPLLGFGYTKPFDHILGSSDGFGSVLQGGLHTPPPHESLVLDGEKGELVKAPARSGKKGVVSEEKILAALKSHSEAERRRRERINAHLATLRGLVPSNEKMDKAALLAEVINQVKELKREAIEATEGLVIPMDDDELKVESCRSSEGGTFCFKAILCCEFRPELLTDILQALDAIREVKIGDVEISTLSGRVKTVITLAAYRSTGDHEKNEAGLEVLASSIQRALCSVMEKGSATSTEYSPRTTFTNKRRRVTLFESSSSSS